MVAAITAEQLGGLLEDVYACATNPANWPAVLHRINQATACHASVVGLISFEESYSLVDATSGFDAGFSQRYGANLDAIGAIWGGRDVVAARPVHEPVVLSLHHPEALVPGTPKHRLLCEVLGFDVEDTLNLPLAHFGRAVGAAGFARRNGQGRFRPKLQRLFRLLSPHIQRSAEINRLLDAHALSLAVRDGLLDLLRVPVAIIDHRMRLVHANRLAQELLNWGPNGTLRLGSPCLVPRRLAQAIADVTSNNASYRCIASGIGTGGEALRIAHVLALDVKGEPIHYGHAAVVLAPVRGVESVATETLASEHGLTRAEIAVLRPLIQGQSTAKIAAFLNLQPSTVRTHVLRIYEKFDVHCRAELVARVSAMAPPFQTPIHQMVDDKGSGLSWLSGRAICRPCTFQERNIGDETFGVLLAPPLVPCFKRGICRSSSGRISSRAGICGTVQKRY